MQPGRAGRTRGWGARLTLRRRQERAPRKGRGCEVVSREGGTAGSSQTPAEARREPPGSRLPTWGGRELQGHPPSASSFSPPLRRLLPSLPARLPGMVEGVGSTRQGGPGRGGRLTPAPATARGAVRGGLRRLGVPQPPPPPPLPVMAKDVLGGGSRGGC